MEAVPVLKPALRLACGWDGLELALPEGVELLVARPVSPAELPSSPDPRALFQAAVERPLAGPPLRELAKGRRRAAVLVGDLSLPAPYPAVLPGLMQLLTECEIRPARIMLVSRPGAGGPVLGLNAIRHYGEETTGQYDLLSWPWRDGAPEPWEAFYEAADLRLAVLPVVPEAAAALPDGAPPGFVLGLTPGRGLRACLAGVRAGPPAAVFGALPAPQTVPEAECAVQLTTGGGAPADRTLEEALVGLRRLRPSGANERAATTVLVFQGDDGLGSARFTLDLWALLRQAEEELAHGGRLPAFEPADACSWDPAGALAQALCGAGRVVLLSPGLAEHDDGDELREQLTACPLLGKRLEFLAAPASLWPALEAIHGPRYRLFAEPLGWRAATPGGDAPGPS